MPSADQQHHLNLDGTQTLSISGPEVPSSSYEHRTNLTIQRDDQHPPATHWPQDIWLNSPSYRVLYQPVLVVPYQQPPLDDSPLQRRPATTSVPDAPPLHDLSQYRTEDPRPEGNPANGCGRYQPNGHAHSESKGGGR